MSKKCLMCKSSDNDELKYGKFITKKDITVHYYCLLLTSNLIQNGHDNQGILGFLLYDIKKEAHRIRHQICCYCELPSAGIGCCHIKCRRMFHLICGINNGAVNQFSQTYRSFCNYHIPKLFRSELPLNTKCQICFEAINYKYPYKYTMCCRSPCCKNGWYHKYCLQGFANSSGYFFKCPLCNNSDKFREIAYNGIFIPDQDASWECEPNAFIELLERPNECSALNCLCKNGRKYKDSNEYEIIFCDTCGSQGIHIHCNNNNSNDFNCVDCLLILSRKSTIKNSVNNLSTKVNESYIEIENSENSFVIIDEFDNNENNEFTAAETLRNLINNNPTEKNSVEFDKIITNTNLEEFEVVQKERECVKKRALSTSEDDEIVQLSRIKKPKIISSSDENVTTSPAKSQSSYRLKNYSTNSSSNSPILQRKNKRKSLIISADSSEDSLPLNYLKIKNSKSNQNNKFLTSEKKINSNLSKSIKKQSLQPSNDSDLCITKSNKRHNGLNYLTNLTDPDSNQNSIKLHLQNTDNCLKVTQTSSEDDIPLAQKKIDQNNIKLNQINIENLKNNTIINDQIVKTKTNSKLNINRISRVRTRSISQDSNKFSCTASIEKPSTSKFSEKLSYSPVNKFNSRDNSESSLSSAEIILKEKIKRVLEKNVKNKKTPLSRKISSSLSTNRIKTYSNKYNSDDDLISSSSLIDKEFSKKIAANPSKINTKTISQSRTRQYNKIKYAEKMHCTRSKTRLQSYVDLSTSSSILDIPTSFTNSSILDVPTSSTVQTNKLINSSSLTSESHHSEVNSFKENKIKRRSSRFQTKNCSGVIEIESNSDISGSSSIKHKSRSKNRLHMTSESNSDYNLQNSKSNIRLRIESETDSDIILSSIKNTYNNKENTEYKNNSHKNNIKRNIKNYGKLSLNDIRKYFM